MNSDALEEWRANQVTQAVLSLIEIGHEANANALKDQLWKDGSADPQMIGRAKAQGELLEDLREATAEDFHGWIKLFRDSPG